MTESEAKTKWCPASRFYGTPSDDVLSNREGRTGGGFRAESCIASDCAAWRWRTVPNPAWSPHQQSMVSFPAPNVYASVPQGIDSTADGYCGLAR